MTTHPQITKANSNHLELLIPLFDEYRRFYKQSSNLSGARQFIGERLKLNDSVIFIACLGATAAGFTQLYPSFSSVGMRRLWILNDLYVDQAFRQCGIASALMAAAEDYARYTKAQGLLLQTGRDNTSARRLYEKRGWVKDESTFYYELSI